LIALSSGVTTALAQTSAFAPVYLVVTETAGGAISGYCVTEREVRAKSPSNTKNKEITNDNTGLLINMRIIAGN
jgi:hypothetical protein